MPRQSPALQAYRRFLVVFGLVAAVLATVIGVVLIVKGKGFFAFLALCIVAYWTGLATWLPEKLFG